MRESVGNEKIIAVLEPRSNTMKMGVHGHQLVDACLLADEAFWFVGENEELSKQLQSINCKLFTSIDSLQNTMFEYALNTQDNVNFVIMSNGGFSGLQNKFVSALKEIR